MGQRYELYSKTNQYIIDGAIIAASFFAAYLLRFEGSIPPQYIYQFWLLFPLIVLGRLATGFLLGVYRRMWRYASISDAIRLGEAYIVFSAIWFGLRVGLPESAASFRIPIGVIAMEFLLSSYLALIVRLLRRISYQRMNYTNVDGDRMRRILLLGAGSAGVMTVKSLLARPDIRIVGFLDDDPKKSGAVIGGIPVLGAIQRLPEVVDEMSVEEVIICFTRGTSHQLKKVWRLCDHLDVRTRIIPELEEIVDGTVQINRLRDLKMEDLLGRETVDLSTSKPEMLAVYKGRRILITGAGGSIGSELARQLLNFEPAHLILLDKDENCLHDLHCQLRTTPTAPGYSLAIADIRNSDRIKFLFEKFRPDVVFHAAAHKHVPLMEMNPSEAILNNVFGTKNVVDQARANGADLFVLISTDKAVNPANIMGASKRLAELVVQDCRSRSEAYFASVRFGNVLSSRGSVVPLFLKQIKSGGPITLTDPNVTRYFMTIPEAVQLVLHVGALRESKAGTYVLDMGDSVRIADLARDLVELSGFQLGENIRIETIGLRPGEKLKEELVGENENMVPTAHPRIFRVDSEKYPSQEGFRSFLAEMRQAAESELVERLYQLIRDYEIGFTGAPPKEVVENSLTTPKVDTSSGT